MVIAIYLNMLLPYNYHLDSLIELD